MFIEYKGCTTDDKLIREKRFKKKKSGDLSWYVVLKHEIKPHEWSGQHLVSVIFETCKDGNCIEREELERQRYKDMESAEKIYNEYIERIKNGKLILAYKFKLGD